MFWEAYRGHVLECVGTIDTSRIGHLETYRISESIRKWLGLGRRLPVQGFAALQGRDGVVRPFTLTSVELAQAIYPRAHTCFNRIDLPLFDDEGQTRAGLDFVLSPAAASAFYMD